MAETAVSAETGGPGAVHMQERQAAEAVAEPGGSTQTSEWRERQRPEMRPFAQAETAEKPLRAFDAPPEERPIPSTWELPAT